MQESGRPAPAKRRSSSVAAPAAVPPADCDFWLSASPPNEATLPNVALLRSHFLAEGRLTDAQATAIVTRAMEVLRSEPNLLRLPAPITICGDIHGQYFDLMKLFDVAGGFDALFGDDPAAEATVDNRLLFLGDYVDRGYFSLECYLLLLALKVAHPSRIFLLRGNHECRHLTSYFTFKKECRYKHSEALYALICESFDCLPMCAIVDDKFFCVHGGISPELEKMSHLDDINGVDRFNDPPKRGLMCDLLWADPHESYGSEPAPASKEKFVTNRVRGCSFYYTFNGVCAFLKKFNLLSVIRGHEAQENGYKLYKKITENGFPSVVTLFSAPNYVDTYKNKAAILKFDGKLFNIRQFNWSSHPYYLPNFMDAFSWSGTFMAEKIIDILVCMLNLISRYEVLSDDLLTDKEKKVLAHEKIKTKSSMKENMKLVGKLQRKLSFLRVQKEALCELKNLKGTPVLPAGSLDVGADELRHQIQTFKEARMSDLINERLPPADATTSLAPDPDFELPRFDGPATVTEKPDCVVSTREFEKLFDTQ